MSDYPEIGVLFMTVEHPERAGVPQRTIKALSQNLVYQGGLKSIIFYPSCKGSDHFAQEIEARIVEAGFGCGKFSVGDVPPGVRWNRALTHIFENHDIYLRLEDDFALERKIDITPYVDVLMNKRNIRDIGMIRLGLMPIGLLLESFGCEGRIYFRIREERPYMYSGNPALIHRRFHDAYGVFHESHNPGDIEIDIDSRARAKDGPMVCWPMAIGGLGEYGAWAHVGEAQSYD